MTHKPQRLNPRENLPDEFINQTPNELAELAWVVRTVGRAKDAPLAQVVCRRGRAPLPTGGAGCRGSERKSYAPRRGITSCRTLTCRGGYAQACYAMVNATDRPSAAIYVFPVEPPDDGPARRNVGHTDRWPRRNDLPERQTPRSVDNHHQHVEPDDRRPWSFSHCGSAETGTSVGHSTHAAPASECHR